MNEEMHQQNTNEQAQTHQTQTDQAPNTPPPATGSAADNRKLMGVLAYIGPLVIIPFLIAKDDPTVKFHIKQGLILLIISVACWFILMALPMFFMFINLINLAVLVLAIIGIVNVVQGQQKELPLVGSFASYFTF